MNDNNTQDLVITEEGLEKLKQELDHRQNNVRPDIADKIQRAIEEGDRSENAAYSDAKEQQALNESMISKIEEQIQNATVVVSATDNVVGMGSVVKLQNTNTNSELTYEIVGQNEADPTSGKISIMTPIAQALLGKKKNSSAKVELPAGAVEFKILDVNNS